MVSAIELQVRDLVIDVRIRNCTEIPVCAFCVLGEVVPARARLVLDDQIKPGGGLGGVVGVRWHEPDKPKQ